MMNRIAITGVESAGKSTLGAALAEALNAVLVEEAARKDHEVLEEKVHLGTLERLGDTQFQACLEAERHALQTGRSTIITDTDATVLTLWGEHVWGAQPKGLEAFAAWPDFTLLCAPTIPWVNDPLRSMPNASDRWALHQKYEERLRGSVPWSLVDANTPQERLDQAVRAFLKFTSNTDSAH